jgi:hypothetical protein
MQVAQECECVHAGGTEMSVRLALSNLRVLLPQLKAVPQLMTSGVWSF